MARQTVATYAWRLGRLVGAAERAAEYLRANAHGPADLHQADILEDAATEARNLLVHRDPTWALGGTYRE